MDLPIDNEPRYCAVTYQSQNGPNNRHRSLMMVQCISHFPVRLHDLFPMGATTPETVRSVILWNNHEGKKPLVTGNLPLTLKEENKDGV
jgi:hypothetical protein